MKLLGRTVWIALFVVIFSSYSKHVFAYTLGAMTTKDGKPVQALTIEKGDTWGQICNSLLENHPLRLDEGETCARAVARVRGVSLGELGNILPGQVWYLPIQESAMPKHGTEGFLERAARQSGDQEIKALRLGIETRDIAIEILERRLAEQGVPMQAMERMYPELLQKREEVRSLTAENENLRKLLRGKDVEEYAIERAALIGITLGFLFISGSLFWFFRRRAKQEEHHSLWVEHAVLREHVRLLETKLAVRSLQGKVCRLPVDGAPGSGLHAHYFVVKEEKLDGSLRRIVFFPRWEIIVEFTARGEEDFGEQLKETVRNYILRDIRLEEEGASAAAKVVPIRPDLASR